MRGPATPDIKICVSCRIDLDSETVRNPLYLPVRCGAACDPRRDTGIQGDDTGENISDRRMTFNEFTVQYWAWKNLTADYYGLCHYRRYLSFSSRRFRTDPADMFNMVREPALCPRSAKKYGLLDEKTMRDMISGCDAVVSEYAPVSKIKVPGGPRETVRQLWEAHDGASFEKKHLRLLFELIDRLSPEYSRSAREYFAGDRHRGFNCYVLKKELFERLCRFQFPILFELERRIDTRGYDDTMRRTPAFFGEMLYGIFLYHISVREHWRIREVQLVYFESTRPLDGPLDYWGRAVRFRGERLLRALAEPLFPRDSGRRAAVKRLLYRGKK